MRAVVKLPHEAAVVRDVDPGLDSLQAVVGGMIEAVELFELAVRFPRITSYANEEGLLLGLDPNLARLQGYELIVGPLLAIGLDDRTGETVELTEEEAEAARVYLDEHAITVRDMVQLGLLRVVEL